VRRRWIRRLLVALLAIFIGLPLTGVLAYRVLPVPVTPLMLIRLTEGEGLAKDWVGIDRISPHLPASVIAAEDNRFCRHGGFDWVEMRNAWAAARDGDRLRGASTISMQTAKNLFLWPGRSYLRKALEFYLTPLIEFAWPKRRIMEVYLNVAEWAPGVYGAEAAARHHFNKSAADLTRREAALLAVVLPNPRNWSAGRPSEYIAGRAATIQRRVGQLGPLLDCL
jgi:monofunctional biosynthetic peptidoglycan transglycosylase